MAKIVFICGALRSGTTLMYLMLNAHPGMKNPGEFDCWFDGIGTIGTEPDMRVARSFLERSRMFRSTRLAINPDCGSYRELLGDMVGQLDDGGVLCLNVHRNFDLVQHYFPDAKFVHVLRDPRDVARSSISMGWAGVTYYGVDHWMEAERSWDRLVKSARPASCFEVKYEDLIADLPGRLTSLCQFIGVDYDSAMAEYHVGSTYSPPDISLTYQWRRVQDTREIELVEAKAKDLIVGRGYGLVSDDPRPPKFVETVHLWLANRAYRYWFFIKRYGLLSWLLHKLMGLFPWLPGARLFRQRMTRITEDHLK